MYIKARLAKSVKKVSIARELTFISKLFKKLKYLDKTLKDIKNPVENYDKDLLKERVRKHEYRMTNKDKEIIIEETLKHRNKQIFQIVNLSLLTAMRRSEILTLTWGQIKDNFIILDLTKTNPRKVYLTEEAKEFIKSFRTAETQPNQQIFNYSISGFDGAFSKILKRINERVEVKLNFKALRKEAISSILEKMSLTSSIIASSFFGISNVKNFENTYNINQNKEPQTQEEYLKSFGHQNAQTTKSFYYSIKNND